MAKPNSAKMVETVSVIPILSVTPKWLVKNKGADFTTMSETKKGALGV
jgi:hypothetical protein